MEKEEQKIKKIDIKGNDKLILYTKCEIIEKLEREIRYISRNIEYYYNIQKTLIIEVLKKENIQDIDTITIFEKLYQMKDEQISLTLQFKDLYNDWCYTNRYDGVLIENFDLILKKINEGIENTNKNFEDIKQTLIDNNKQIYDLIRENLEKEYRYMVESINKSIKKINKIKKEFMEYGIITSEVFLI